MNKKIFLVLVIFGFLILGSFFVSAKACCERLKEPGEGQTDWCQVAEDINDCRPKTEPYDSDNPSDGYYGNKPNVESCKDTLSNCNMGCIYTGTGSCANVAIGRCILDGGIPQDEPIGEISYCNEGCCIMGEYADIITETACQIWEDSYDGGESTFIEGTTNQNDCEAEIESQEWGACVITSEFGLSHCAMMTNVECDKDKLMSDDNDYIPENWGSNLLEGLHAQFRNGYLCTASINGNPISSCIPSTDTICQYKRVYWKDSCGNTANIYDTTKIDANGEFIMSYWQTKKDPEESCETSTIGGDSECGNCDEINNICKYYGDLSSSDPLTEPEYNDGELVCGSLDCIFNDANGDDITYKNGQRWCDGGITGALANSLVEVNGVSSVRSIYQYEDDEFTSDTRRLLEDPQLFNLPGSRYFLLQCIQGEVKVEPCQDYRNEVCVESVRELDDTHCVLYDVEGDGRCMVEESEYERLMGASCIPNVFSEELNEQGCTYIMNKDSCEGTGRLCKWVPGYRMDGEEVPEGDRREEQGSCVPLVAPGLPFWDGRGAGWCAQAGARENTLFETGASRDRDDFNFETWSIGKRGLGIDDEDEYLGERCYYKCYTIPHYAEGFNSGMVNPVTLEKIYPQDIRDASPNLDWGDSNQVFHNAIGGDSSQTNIVNPTTRHFLRTDYDEHRYLLLSLFYDRPRFDLDDQVRHFYLSRRDGQYCWKKDDHETWETGRVDGKSYDCSSINDYGASLRRARDYPIYLTHEEWLTYITERARSLGDCGYKPTRKDNIEEYTNPLSEYITVIFEKMDRDNPGEVERILAYERAIYYGDEEEDTAHKLKFDRDGEDVPQDIVIQVPDCPEGTQCRLFPVTCAVGGEESCNVCDEGDEGSGLCGFGEREGTCCNPPTSQGEIPDV